MPLKHRLLRLADRARQAGYQPGACPACRDRQGVTALVISRQRVDGTIEEEGDGPLPCTVCGQVPEMIQPIVEVIVESRGEVERLRSKESLPCP